MELQPTCELSVDCYNLGGDIVDNGFCVYPAIRIVMIVVTAETRIGKKMEVKNR